MRLALLIMTLNLALNIPVPSVALETQPVPTEKRAANEARFRSIEYGTTFLKDVESNSLIALQFDDLPKAIKSQLYNRLAAVVLRDAHPQRKGRSLQPGRMTVRVFAALNHDQDDLVEYRWSYMGQYVRAVASRNALRLEFDLDELGDNPAMHGFGWTEIERVSGFVHRLLRMQDNAMRFERPDYSLDIPWPEELKDGVQFSTNPEHSINAMDGKRWFERVDICVRQRMLSMLFYFKSGRLMFPRDGSHWFPDDFRAEVLQRARELGKRPVEPDHDR